MTRGVADDLSNRRFGSLVVQHRNGSDAQKNALWLCQCDCGNHVDVRAPFLKKGQRFCSKQCPEYARENRADIIGQRFGELTALWFVKVDAYQKAVWRFLCDCGTEADISIGNISNGHTTSCGCGEIRSRIKHGLSQTREYHRVAYKEWAKRNPAKVIANAYRRTEALRQRVPAWLSDEHWERINAFYLEARRKTEETGIVHHVDHVFPLRGKTMSGLHVPWNLQVLTAAENLRKAASVSDEVC